MSVDRCHRDGEHLNSAKNEKIIFLFTRNKSYFQHLPFSLMRPSNYATVSKVTSAPC